MDYISIKNWEKFQHYKDRSPPWIKLHREILDDYEFSSLSDEAKCHVMLIWVLASQNDNKLPADPAWLKKRLGVTSKIDINHLIKHGFLILERSASSLPLEERRDRGETEEIKINAETLSIEHVQEWLDGKRSEGKYLEIDEFGLLEKFKNYCRSKTPKYKDYPAAFRNAFEWQNVPLKGKQNGNQSGKQKLITSNLDAAEEAIRQASPAPVPDRAKLQHF